MTTEPGNFVLMGVTADEHGRPSRDALQPSLYNPVRTSLKPVLIFSDNKPSDFVTVNADGVAVASKADDIAWAENSPGLADAKIHAKWDSVVSKFSPGMSPYQGEYSPAKIVLSNWSHKIDDEERIALPSSMLLTMNEPPEKEKHEERASNDSVIDFLSKPLSWLGLA